MGSCFRRKRMADYDPEEWKELKVKKGGKKPGWIEYLVFRAWKNEILTDALERKATDIRKRGGACAHGKEYEGAALDSPKDIKEILEHLYSR